jgi:hypothetical protein
MAPSRIFLLWVILALKGNRFRFNGGSYVMPQPNKRISQRHITRVKWEHKNSLKLRAALLKKDLDSNGNVLLYAVLNSNCIKIGITKDIRRRFAQLKSCSPFPVSLLGFVRCHRQMEARLHALLKADRIHGEWFKATDAVLLVAACISKGKSEDLEILLAEPVSEVA